MDGARLAGFLFWAVLLPAAGLPIHYFNWLMFNRHRVAMPGAVSASS